eukprot:742500-Pyramimonas_sp.AAC.1
MDITHSAAYKLRAVLDIRGAKRRPQTSKPIRCETDSVARVRWSHFADTERVIIHFDIDAFYAQARDSINQARVL